MVSTLAMSLTLYVRLALAVVRSISTHISWTDPNSDPDPEEEAAFKTTEVGHFEKTKFSVHSGRTVVKVGTQHATPVREIVMPSQYLVHVIDILDIIAALSPDGLYQTEKYSRCITPATITGTLLMCAGAAIRVLAYRALGQLFTFRLSIRKDHHLITTGPYAVVRHPSYSGAMLYLIGTGVALLGPRSVYSELGLWRKPYWNAVGAIDAVMLIFVYSAGIMRMYEEDRVMREQFKDEWTEWAKRTPYKIIPYIW